MSFSKQLRHVFTTLLLALHLLPASSFATSRAPEEAEYTGLRVQVDNDLFAGRSSDWDYTGGFAVTLSGRSARDSWLSLDALLAGFDRQIIASKDLPTVRHARQIGLMAFTPLDTLSPLPQPQERPYASLVFVSNGRVQVAADNRSAWSSSLTFGVMGLSLTDRLHSEVHEIVGSREPRGYGFQISAGGEPTARYSVAKHSLWIANPASTLDVKTTVQGSVGYLTEASAAISIRIGRFHTPWWGFTPELTDYISAPTPVTTSSSATPEVYCYAGAKVKARAYNVFLQGQFRHSEVRHRAADLEQVITEAWIGVTTQIFQQTQVSYTLNYQSPEFRHGRAARDSLWGAVQLSHRF